MLVGDFWNERLENWARFYGVKRSRPLVSQMGAVLAFAPEVDPEDERQRYTQAGGMDARADADRVDALLLHPRVDPVGRLFIVYVWGRRYSLGSFKRPKKEVVRAIRDTVSTMESIEKNRDMISRV